MGILRGHPAEGSDPYDEALKEITSETSGPPLVLSHAGLYVAQVSGPHAKGSRFISDKLARILCEGAGEYKDKDGTVYTLLGGDLAFARQTIGERGL